MDEIIAKLRMEDAAPPEEPPEPMTARVTMQEFRKERQITPPPLNYHSPFLQNRFYNKIPDWIHPPHVSALSLEKEAFQVLSEIHKDKEVDKNSELVADDFIRLKRSYEKARAITPEHSKPSVMSRELKNELYEAIYIFNNAPKLNALLESGVDTSEPLNNSMGYCCIHYAAEIGDFQICQLLCEFRANPNLPTYTGLTAAMIAAHKGNLGFLVALCRYGGDIYLKDRELGRNSLHWAVLNSQFETVQFLIEEFKMNVYEQDRTGRNVIQLARDYYKRDVSILIEKCLRHSNKNV